ncbi:hypothetical protein AD998_11850 [bacterium 336/3]|nr:hypothetical protein AD998_11850 [bacterium 336/3]
MYLVTKYGGGIYDDIEIPVSSINQVAFWLRTDVRYYGSINLFSGGFSAMALDCVSISESKETIESLEVYSDKDFEGYPAGTNLAPIMYIRNMRSNFAGISEFIALRLKVDEGYELIFKENTKISPSNHVFRVVFKDSKGKIFEMSKEVKFK